MMTLLEAAEAFRSTLDTDVEQMWIRAGRQEEWGRAVRQFEAALHAARLVRDGITCEHGARDGDWCEQCRKEYQRAREEAERT